MGSYSSEMKEAMVQKLCVPGGPSALQLSKLTGISQTALSRWKRELGTGTMSKKQRAEDWTPQEKFQAVMQAQALRDEELGAFLRENGLHSSDIAAWKEELSEAFVASKKPRGRPRKDPELVQAEEQILQLKRDLRRKEKALAEQTAIVILQKKVRGLWGHEDDE